MRESSQEMETRSFSGGEGVYNTLVGDYDFYNDHFYSHIAEGTLSNLLCLRLFDSPSKHPEKILDLCFSNILHNLLSEFFKNLVAEMKKIITDKLKTVSKTVYLYCRRREENPI